MSRAEAVDVCVVGGGQSALALGYYLRRAERERGRAGHSPLSVVILDRRDRPGGAWLDA